MDMPPYETEWEVICANGHRFYERVRGAHPAEIQAGKVTFSDCPKCGAPRRGEQLPPVR